jgi:hypothetical protein
MLATIADSPAGAPTQTAQAAGALPLAGRRLAVSDGACACVVMASSGYPGRCETGKDISGLEIADPRAGVKGSRPRDGAHFRTDIATKAL